MIQVRWLANRRIAKHARSLVRIGNKAMENLAGEQGQETARKLVPVLKELQERLIARPLDPAAVEKVSSRLETLLVDSGILKKKGTIRQYAESIAWALAIALVVRFFLFEPFRIPTGSMIPTLQIGDHIFVSKSAYGIRLPLMNRYLVSWAEPQLGDVVVFPFPVEGDPDYGKDFIKRVVGLPGQGITLVNNVLHVDGRPITVSLDKGYAMDSCPGIPTLACRYVQQTENLGEHTFVSHHCDPASCENRSSWPDPLAGWAWPPEGGRMPYRIPDGHVLAMGDNRDNSRDGREWGIVPIDSLKGKALVVWLAKDRSRMFSRIP